MATKLHHVGFDTKDGLRLPGLLFEPVRQAQGKPARKSKKAVIYLHGMGSSVIYKDALHNELGRKLTKAGYAHFPFQNRGADLIRKPDKITGKQYGMAYELIRDCVYDIDAAISFLWKRGYREIILMGHSTGANKIALYNYLKPRNRTVGYILAGAGDDTGLYYGAVGKKKFEKAITEVKLAVKQKRGAELAPERLLTSLAPIMSYQSLFDMINPDGDYNTFPFYEVLNNLKLTKQKKRFREFASIKKPTLVVYGAEDPYCSGTPDEANIILCEETPHPELFTFSVIKGAGHSFTDKERELATVVTAWLKSQ